MRYDVAPLPDYHPEIGLLVAALQDGTREWREEFVNPSEDAVVWQPFEGSHSIGGLILHMIECETWWFEVVGAGRTFDPKEAEELMCDQINQYQVSWPTAPRKPISYYFELQDRYRARTLETLKSFDPDLERQLGSGDKVDVFTLRWIVNHIVAHEAYHGGQAVFLNLLHDKVKSPA